MFVSRSGLLTWRPVGRRPPPWDLPAVPGKGQPRLPPGLVQARAADSAPAAAGASLTANRNMFLRMSAPPSPARLVFGRGEPFDVWKGDRLTGRMPSAGACEPAVRSDPQDLCLRGGEL